MIEPDEAEAFAQVLEVIRAGAPLGLLECRERATGNRVVLISCVAPHGSGGSIDVKPLAFFLPPGYAWRAYAPPCQMPGMSDHWCNEPCGSCPLHLTSAEKGM